MRRRNDGTNAPSKEFTFQGSSWKSPRSPPRAAGASAQPPWWQQHSNNKLNFELIWERIPAERANHNYRPLSARKDLSVIVGRAENISSVISTAGDGEKKTTRVEYRATPRGTAPRSPPPKGCWQRGWERLREGQGGSGGGEQLPWWTFLEK